MILWTVQGVYRDPDEQNSRVDTFQWFPTKPVAEKFIKDTTWCEHADPPVLIKQHVPGGKAAMVQFLNHFAGA